MVALGGPHSTPASLGHNINRTDAVTYRNLILDRFVQAAILSLSGGHTGALLHSRGRHRRTMLVRRGSR